MDYKILSPSSNKNVFLVFSILGWLMYLICGWISLKWLFKDINILGYSNVMTILRLKLYTDHFGHKAGTAYPLQILDSILYIVVILTMILATLGFIVFIVKSLIKKDGTVSDGMLGGFAKFHFVSLFIAGGLFLTGICFREIDSEDKWKKANIAGIILVVLGLASMIFIYSKTNLGEDWQVAPIKKGAYSSLIAIEWYYFCYIICNLIFIDGNLIDIKNIINQLKNCNIAMPIVEGVGALAFAYFFKDVIVAFMNVLIFLGAAIYYLSIYKDYRSNSGGHDSTEGIIDIIFAVLSVVVIVVLIVTKKKECLK